MLACVHRELAWAAWLARGQVFECDLPVNDRHTWTPFPILAGDWRRSYGTVKLPELSRHRWLCGSRRKLSVLHLYYYLNKFIVFIICFLTHTHTQDNHTHTNTFLVSLIGTVVLFLTYSSIIHHGEIDDQCIFGSGGWQRAAYFNKYAKTRSGISHVQQFPLLAFSLWLYKEKRALGFNEMSFLNVERTFLLRYIRRNIRVSFFSRTHLI